MRSPDTKQIAISEIVTDEILASRWKVDSPAAQDAVADAVLSVVSRPAGLRRHSILRGIDDQTVLHVSEWTEAAARDSFELDEAQIRAKLDAASPTVEREWQMPATFYRRVIADADQAATCLVAVRQPLERPDPAVQRHWVDTVVTALTSDEPPLGLRSATFFTSVDGVAVLNLAEWADADAHREALKPSDIGQRASLGKSDAWRATREVPGITAAHDVGRYELVAPREQTET